MGLGAAREKPAGAKRSRPAGLPRCSQNQLESPPLGLLLAAAAAPAAAPTCPEPAAS